MRFLLIDFQHLYSGGFGTLGIVTLLRKLGHAAFVIGGNDIIDLINDIDKFKSVMTAESPDLIGFSVMTPYADYIDIVGKIIHESIGNIPIIVGGYHATIFRKKIFDETKYVDYVAVGDAEETLPLLLDNINSGNMTKIRGILARDDIDSHKMVKDSDQETVNLDHIPLPDETVVHPEYYSPSILYGHSSTPSPSRYVLYSRGCPFRCSFCKIENDDGFRSKYRHYSPNMVIEHLGALTERFHLQGISFLDDNFTLDKDWAYKVCEGIIKNRMKIKWWAQVRANLVDRDMIKIMREAGCIVATITIESGNDRIRHEIMKKETTRSQIERAYKLAKKLGMLTQGTLMVGSPTETYEELKDSINFLRKVDPDWAGIVFTTILPGTPLYYEYSDQIKVTCYRDYDIALQESNYSRNDVRLGFHKIPVPLLLETFHSIRAEYSYERRVKQCLRNLTCKERFLWMLRTRKRGF